MITVDPPEIGVMVGCHGSDLETGSRLTHRDAGDSANVPDQRHVRIRDQVPEPDRPVFARAQQDGVTIEMGQLDLVDGVRMAAQEPQRNPAHRIPEPDRGVGSRRHRQQAPVELAESTEADLFGMPVEDVTDLGTAVQVPQPGGPSCASRESQRFAVDLCEGDSTDAIRMSSGRLGDGQIPDASSPVFAHRHRQASFRPDDERGSLDQAHVAAERVALLPQTAEVPELAVLGPGGQDPWLARHLLDSDGGHTPVLQLDAPVSTDGFADLLAFAQVPEAEHARLVPTRATVRLFR